MREIKFRFWFKRYKEMSESYSLFKFGKDVEEESDFDDTLIPMQYIGLKDKNGKEIYEGDVLKRIYEEWEKDEEEQLFLIKTNMEESKGSYNGIIYGWKIPDFDWDWEIIGNIYENPELAQDLTS